MPTRAVLMNSLSWFVSKLHRDCGVLRERSGVTMKRESPWTAEVVIEKESAEKQYVRFGIEEASR
jgi:hypothetical protein